MATETRALIPASNFEVRNVGLLRVQTSRYGYIIKTGFGLWDRSAAAWVSGVETIEGNRVVVPWAFARRHVAQKAKQDGLFEGYLTAR